MFACNQSTTWPVHICCWGICVICCWGQHQNRIANDSDHMLCCRVLLQMISQASKHSYTKLDYCLNRSSLDFATPLCLMCIEWCQISACQCTATATMPNKQVGALHLCVLFGEHRTFSFGYKLWPAPSSLLPRLIDECYKRKLQCQNS